jgi:hypothetical protein
MEESNVILVLANEKYSDSEITVLHELFVHSPYIWR